MKLHQVDEAHDSLVMTLAWKTSWGSSFGRPCCLAYARKTEIEHMPPAVGQRFWWYWICWWRSRQVSSLSRLAGNLELLEMELSQHACFVVPQKQIHMAWNETEQDCLQPPVSRLGAGILCSTRLALTAGTFHFRSSRFDFRWRRQVPSSELRQIYYRLELLQTHEMSKSMTDAARFSNETKLYDTNDFVTSVLFMILYWIL